MRRIIRVPLADGTGLAAGGTSRVAVVATTVPCQIASYSITTDCKASDEYPMTLTVKRGSTPGTLPSAATPAQLESVAVAGVDVYGTGCSEPSGTVRTLASPYFNPRVGYGATLGAALSGGEAVTFAVTGHASQVTNPIKYVIELVVENT